MKHNALRGENADFFMWKTWYMLGSALLSVQLMTVTSLRFGFGSFVDLLVGPVLHVANSAIFFYKTVKNKLEFLNVYLFLIGPGSSVGIATDYGLESPGSNPGG